MQEREIDLIKVLYKACREWRKAIVCGVILGLVFGIFSFIDYKKLVNDKEAFSYELSLYENEHRIWESQNGNYAAQLDNLFKEETKLKEYSENSVLMKIDPLNEFIGSFDLYVDSGYQINPNLTYQNLDYTGTILAAYAILLQKGDFYDHIVDSVDFLEDVKYAKEIVNCEIDNEAAFINISVIGPSPESVLNVLDAVKSEIDLGKDIISNGVREHKLVLLNESIYSTVDFELQEVQAEHNSKIALVNDNLQSVSAKVKNQIKTPEPEFKYEPMEIFKEFIKRVIVGGVVGVILVCGYYFVAAVFSNKYSSDNLAYCTPAGTKDLGTVFIDRPRRKMGKIDNLVAKIFGVNTNVLSLADSSALVGSNISNIAKTIDEPKIAYVGLGETNLSKQIVEKMHSNINYVGDITNCVEASKSLQNYTHVVIAAEEDVNSMEDIQRQCDLVKGWGKDIIGVVTIK